MIVRILHEGQYKISGADLDRINAVDNQIVQCVSDGNEESFGKLLTQLLDMVRECGTIVPVEEFVESDVILPSSDSTMEEVKDLFTGDGLVPG